MWECSWGAGMDSPAFPHWPEMKTQLRPKYAAEPRCSSPSPERGTVRVCGPGERSPGLAAGSLRLPGPWALPGILPGQGHPPSAQQCRVAGSVPRQPVRASRCPPVLTELVDARVVAELQHVEVPALDAAADAVDAGDVGALALHAEQGLHQLLVAMVEEAEGGRPLEQQQGSHEGPQPPRHPASPGSLPAGA